MARFDNSGKIRHAANSRRGRSCSYCQLFDCPLDGVAQPFHDLLDLVLTHRVRWREHDEVAFGPIYMSDVRPDDEMRIERGTRERLREVNGAGERAARGRVLGELDAREESSASNGGDVRQLAQLGEPSVQLLAHARTA